MASHQNNNNNNNTNNQNHGHHNNHSHSHSHSHHASHSQQQHYTHNHQNIHSHNHRSNHHSHNNTHQHQLHPQHQHHPHHHLAHQTQSQPTQAHQQQQQQQQQIQQLPQQQQHAQSQSQLQPQQPQPQQPQQQSQSQQPQQAACPLLTRQIYDTFLRARQSNETYILKAKLREKLYNILRKCFKSSIDLYIVGSSINNLGNNNSDVDMCLVITDREIDQATEGLTILQFVRDQLRQYEFVRRCNLILAKVPLLRFEDGGSAVAVDLNVNNSVGIRNTHLINCYTRLDVMSIRLGGTIDKETARNYVNSKNTPTQWRWICIEEPFDRTNTARSVWDEQAFREILNVFRSSHYRLERSKNLNSIM